MKFMCIALILFVFLDNYFISCYYYNEWGHGNSYGSYGPYKGGWNHWNIRSIHNVKESNQLASNLIVISLRTFFWQTTTKYHIALIRTQ